MKLLKYLWFCIQRDFLALIGYDYIVNLNPRRKEIHGIYSDHNGWHLSDIKRKKYIREKDVRKWINEGYDGCFHCLPKLDKRRKKFLQA